MARPRIVPALVASLLAMTAARVGVSLWAAVVAADTLPQWDMAKYGLSGLRMADSLRRVDPVALLGEIERSELWPPLFAVVETPVYLALGDEHRTPILVALLAWAASMLAIWWAARQLDPDHGDIAGVLAAAALAASPLHRLFGGLVMLEAAGALLLLLALGCYARWLRTRRPVHARLAWLAVTALFFLKYNYGVAWLLAVGFSEGWSALGSPAGARAWAGARLAQVKVLSRKTLLAAAATLTVLGAALFGGRLADVGGVDRRAIPLGWPIWSLYAVILLRAAVTPRRSWERLRVWYGRLSVEPRAFVACVVAPIALWMLSPRHAVGFFAFLENRTSGIAWLSLESLSFYPRTFLLEVAPTPAIGAAAMILAALGMTALVRAEPPRRALLLALAIGTGALVLHPYKQPRFVLTVAPLVWLAAADALVAGLARIAPGRVAPDVTRTLAVLFAAGVAVVPPVGDSGRLRRGLAEHGVSASVRPVLDALLTATAGPRETVLVGYWNNLSPALVEWHYRSRSSGPQATAAPRPPRRLVRPEDAGSLPARAWDEGVQRLLVLDLAPDGLAWRPGWDHETGWLDPARQALAGDPRWLAEPTRFFEDSGYRLTTYRRASP